MGQTGVIMRGAPEATKAFAEDIINIYEMRFLSIIMHQQIENCIDSIISRSFKHPEKIFKSHNNFGFKEKYIIVEALGIFDYERGKKLKTNIDAIQQLRNQYAHADSVSGKKILPKQEHLIKTMHNFFDQLPKADLVLRFKTDCLSTMMELNKALDVSAKEPQI
jgi:hypothetical protein